MLATIVSAALALGASTSADADGIAPAPFAQAHEAAPEKAVQIGDTWLGLIHEHDPHDRFRLVTLVSQGGAWKTARSRTIGDEYVYYTLADGPSAVSLAGREYAYFSFSVTRQGTAYAGLGEVEFRLADVRTLEDFALLYDGELRGSKVKGQATPDAALPKRPELLQFLDARRPGTLVQVRGVGAGVRDRRQSQHTHGNGLPGRVAGRPITPGPVFRHPTPSVAARSPNR